MAIPWIILILIALGLVDSLPPTTSSTISRRDIFNDYSEEFTIFGTILYLIIACIYGAYIFIRFMDSMDSKTATPKNENQIKVMMAPGTRSPIRVVWALFKVVFWPLVPLLEVGEITVQKWCIPALKKWCVTRTCDWYCFKMLARARGYDRVAVTDIESQKTTKTNEDFWCDELSTAMYTGFLSPQYAPAA